MHASSEIPPSEQHPNLAAGILMRFGQIAIVFIVQAVILFLAAGRLNWTWAWVYLGMWLVSVAINGTLLLRSSPETVAERGRPKETQDWDKLVSGLYALAMYLALPLLAGLDVLQGCSYTLFCFNLIQVSMPRRGE